MLIQGIRVKIGNRLILSDIQFELSRGVNLVLGQNGAGKTTLLRSVIQVLRGTRQGYVPSEFSSPEISVEDVLLAGTRNRLRNYETFIDSLGIRRLLSRAFSTLSTGEKKLVLITKALAEGELVVMDEPTSGLDVRNQARVISVISSLRTEKSFLIATHDLNWIGMADWVMVMKGGKIIWQSTANELKEEVLENAYESKVKRINVDGKNIFILSI